MNIAVVSYSLTGNNRQLAEKFSQTIGAKHIAVTEAKKRTMGTTICDLLLHRTPKAQPAAETLDSYDLRVYFAPIWMGSIAAPLRACLNHQQNSKRPYAFVCISGGAGGPNGKLEGELLHRTGSKPVLLIDLHIADLLPAVPKPTMKDTSAYRLTARDVETLCAQLKARFAEYGIKEYRK